jgi:PAS domain S-box-containing protein
MTPIAVDAHEEIESLRARLGDAEETLRAIQHGEIDALVVDCAEGNRVYTLHSADEPYRNLVEQMHEGAVVLTRGGDILYANARFAALVGEPLESVAGSRIDRFIAPASREEAEALWTAGTGRCRCRLVGADGVPFEVSLSVRASTSAGGDRLNVIVTDLSELLAATSSRERAERDNRGKDEFLAMLAHELRTPLSAIRNAVRVLELTSAWGDNASRAHAVIGRQVGHVSRLVDDLLDVERVVCGKIRLNRQPFDLSETVCQAVAAFTDDPRLNRRVDVSVQSVWVDGDAVRLAQVATNILANAVKYTPPGGRIDVTLLADGGEVVLCVEDSGFGISAALLPSIFDLYVQADRTLDRARGGLGIGLTVVRRLVEAHGGTVTASSDGEGRGSRFTVRLREVPAGLGSVRVEVPLEQGPRSRRVLLIEDCVDAREMLRMMLQLDGHEVYDAPDGVRGLELLDVVRPDVGIIDINLPMMDGYQIARRIREEPSGRGMLLLALTGADSPDDSIRSLEYGFDHHLVKPVDPDLLARLMKADAQAS